MRYLSQRDSSWCLEKLGSSSLTVGRYGCTTCCISMLSDYFGHFVSPIVLSHNTANYTKDGLIIWGNLNLKGMKFVRRDYTENPTAIALHLKDPDKAVLLQVNYGQHWVVGIRKSLFGNDYVVADPWNGDKCNAKSRYHNVTGTAYFTRA